MGKDSILNQKQKLILGKFQGNKELADVFYFTGGTALSEFYLKHRESIDLDFFCKEKFDAQMTSSVIESWANELNLTYTARVAGPTNIYILKFPDGEELKVDFSYYPYNQLKEKIEYGNLKVDSLLDIGANKLMTISQRHTVKDYVDLYFIMQEFNFWELKDGLEYKFKQKVEPILISADFLAVQDFEILPKMYKKLTSDELKEFFQKQSKSLRAMTSYS